jgi:alpha-beta hydrolase superfamily lysophospholipase
MSAVGVLAQPHEIDLADGVTMRAHRWLAGERQALLVHDLGADLDEVGSIGRAFVGAGFTTTGIDQIGHGTSDDRASASSRGLADDLVELVDLLGIGIGVYLVGVGRAAGGCLTAAAVIQPSLVALVSPRDVAGVPRSVLVADRSPTLVAFGALDPACEAEARHLAGARPGPSRLVRMGTAAQAASLLAGPLGPQVVNHIVGYARQIAPRRPGGGS